MPGLLPEGYTCVCGEIHKFPTYVYAHWDDPLIHNCPKCGKPNEIVDGEVQHDD